ncbi:glycoside hydrolase family 2 protein [Sunxiuqinia sp. sy24]|uniref:glycoside hydrolase family 2 protein n=1 Tax=Sunxiuqinia sp. sy24 TaxID=3461495 RepID=UPI004046152D
MKKFSLLVAILICTLAVGAQLTFDRQKLETIRWSPLPSEVMGINKLQVELNGNWHFNPSPEESFWTKKTVANWKTIEVPGEWVMQGFEVEAGQYAGYHRNFQLPESWNGYRIKLKCEAVYSECAVWVNGQKVGGHLGGFTPFELDVTDAVKKGENTIALQVRSESVADTLSSGSQYAVHPLGGISRPIYLVALPEVNVASFHVRTQFDENYEDADLLAEFTLSNETAQSHEVTLNFELTDNLNQTVAYEGDNKLTVDAQEGRSTVTAKLNVKKPAQWDPEHPNLYHLHCVVLVDGKETATIVRRFGFKQTEVRGNQVFVNNRPIKLKGVCRHEVDPLRGRSLTGNTWYEDVKLFKEGNVNYIRTSHYPPNQKLLDACDELGMFVEVEGPFCWAGKKPVNNSNYFEAIVQPILEMVELNKSHPSVLHWSIANESYDFNELFKEAADLVKEADPSRPRIFSQYGPDGDGEYLELANHHYPGPGGPDKYKNHKRPITFDEYVHLNAYNRFELMTDPGVRDFWGDILYHMWEKMYAAKGVLGGALWAGIDDTFFLPSGHAVGYGTWGPVDGWRRPKPEYWHMKKIYSPVKIKLENGQGDESVKLTIENRYFFSNLKECRIVWTNNDEQGILAVDAEPGATVEAILPFSNDEIGKLAISVYKDSEVAVDEYAYDLSMPKAETLAKNDDRFKWSQKGDQQIAVSKKLKVEFGPEGFHVSDSKGHEVLSDWPVLMLVSANNKGDTQMTKETPDYTLYSPTASNRSIRSVELEKGETQLKIILTEGYDEATGTMEINIQADGNMNVSYDYTMLKNENFRQWGVALSLPETFNTLSWEKKGLWSVYPEDHIGRLEGEAKLFYNDERCGLAGPSKQPSWAYHQDQTAYGSNDFRSTKRNVFHASLSTEEESTLELKSDGSQHIRSWLENGNIHWLVAGYDNPGSERFLRGFSSHARLYDIPLTRGQKLSGQIKLTITEE